MAVYHLGRQSPFFEQPRLLTHSGLFRVGQHRDGLKNACIPDPNPESEIRVLDAIEIALATAPGEFFAAAFERR
ncbi:hypothetical protein M404DRAFT_1002231 [Pisolithus tinctorius Marx 270]|uniref:Uncharacterized protein n=1 Tax=Pisolithus tinctorius Marx 270 TaxID=870435 RepID=A0A0C3P537_PISTI|nr:hypothetical protein M404DRAFT_1002231 [Pisolithus tinctorius Marx 270]